MSSDHPRKKPESWNRGPLPLHLHQVAEDEGPGRLAVYQDEDQGHLEAVVQEEIDRLPAHFRTALFKYDLMQQGTFSSVATSPCLHSEFDSSNA
jgi:hypothetical protein